jgi:two-component system response regulator FixJ
MALPQIVDSKSTILVLDDDVAVLGSLQFLLETHGFAVSTFQSPVAMLDWARVNAFDCVVVDYKMPDFDGLQVAAQLRERGVTAPVILVTGFPDDSIFIKAAAVGIRQVLLKPHIEDSLVARIQELSLGAPALQGQPDPGADLRKHT